MAGLFVVFMMVFGIVLAVFPAAAMIIAIPAVIFVVIYNIGLIANKWNKKYLYWKDTENRLKRNNLKGYYK